MEVVTLISSEMVTGTVWEVSGESLESVRRVFLDCPRTFWRLFRDFFGISGPEPERP